MPCLVKSLASTRRKAVTQLLVAAESDKKLISKEGGNMAGFGGGASSTGNMADSAVSDAKQMAKTAADVYNAGREAQKMRRPYRRPPDKSRAETMSVL